MSESLASILSAATFAAERHRDQRRKNVEASPYINHPLAVAKVLATGGGVTNVDLLVAALLHDTVEDTATSFNELTSLFGSAVSNLVAEVTDDKQLPKECRKQMQIETAPHKSDNAKQLKIADKICNIRDINANSPTGWDSERKAQYLNWAVQVVEGCRGVNVQLDRLFHDAIREARHRLSI